MLSRFVDPYYAMLLELLMDAGTLFKPQTENKWNAAQVLTGARCVQFLLPRVLLLCV